MQAFDRFAAAIEARDQTIGARRSPGFLDAELLDAADLGRLAIVETAVQRRTDPQFRRHRLHHRLAEFALTQHEFGELGTDAEERHPVVAGPAADDTAGVARIVLDDHALPVAGARERRQPVRPGFADPDLVAVVRDDDAGGPRQFVRAHPRIAQIRAAGDQPAGSRAVLHQVGQPCFRRIGARAVGCVDGTVRRHGHRGRTGDRFAAGVVELSDHRSGGRKRNEALPGNARD